jgi:hypothetical protein
LGKLIIKFCNLIFVIFSLFPSTTDLKNLRKYYSDDGGETVNFERFVCALALDKFSPRVAAMNAKLWAKLDPSNSGCTDANCIEKCLRKKEF